MSRFTIALFAFFIALSAVMPLRAAEFLVQKHPVATSDIEIFLGPPNERSSASLCILSGNTLLVSYPEGAGARATKVRFPSNVSAFDIVEGDTPGTQTVYFVAGDGVYRQSLSREGTEPAELLFEESSLLSYAAERARPYVLIVSFEGQRLIALPSSSGLKLFDFEGKTIHAFPDEAPGASDARPISAWVVSPPVPKNSGVAFRGDTTYDHRVEIPEMLLGKSLKREDWHGTYAQANEARHSPADRWPWFSLRAEEPDQGRVLYAVATPTNRANTRVRFARPDTREVVGGSEATQVTPARTYPGVVVIPRESLPDFNGDGYTDLLLWDVPVPGTSVDSLVRTAQQRSWPVRFTVHTYSRARGLYSGRPVARLEARVPVSWAFMSSGQLPVRNLLLGDMNGDGYTDLGFSTTPTRFALWLYTPGQGFGDEANYTAELPERIRELSLHRDATDAERPYVVLRGEHAVYVLRVP